LVVFKTICREKETFFSQKTEIGELEQELIFFSRRFEKDKLKIKIRRKKT